MASKYSGFGPALGLGGYILAGQLIKFEAGPAAIFSVLLAALSALGSGELLYCPTALQRFPEKELRGLSMNFLCHVPVNDFTIGLPILLQENMWTDSGNI